MAEHFPEHERQTPLQQSLGEIAVQAEQQLRHPFEVSHAELAAVVPSIDNGVQAFKRFMQTTEQPAAEGDMESGASPSTTEEADTARQAIDIFNRNEKRKSMSTYVPHLRRIVRTGVSYLAMFDTDEERIEKGRKIFIPAIDRHLGDIFESLILPAAAPLRSVWEAGHVASCIDIYALDGTDEESIAKQYVLAKALAHSGDNTEEATAEGARKMVSAQEIDSASVLHLLIASHEIPVHQHLSGEMRQGVFDRLIARDVLAFAESGQQSDKYDFTKVEQLASFIKAFAGELSDTAQLRERMLEVYDAWPLAQRQTIIEVRQAIVSRLDQKALLAARAARENNLIPNENAGTMFMHSLENVAEEIWRHVPVTAGNKADVMRMRTLKRGRQTSRRSARREARNRPTIYEETDTTAETHNEPLKVVSCNLNDFSVVEGVEVMIDEFVKNASQGNVTLREDLVRMVNFMARTDLPPTHRRGVKPIGGALVKFGIDDDPDKLWDFFEFKPTEAAGLPTRTSIAKNSRIYFIKYDTDTLGIIGIKPKPEQDNFLRSIRIKNKRRD